MSDCIEATPPNKAFRLNIIDEHEVTVEAESESDAREIGHRLWADRKLRDDWQTEAQIKVTPVSGYLDVSEAQLKEMGI